MPLPMTQRNKVDFIRPQDIGANSIGGNEFHRFTTPAKEIPPHLHPNGISFYSEIVASGLRLYHYWKHRLHTHSI